MSSKKYVLNTNGKIIRTTIEESGNSITEEIKPVSATRDQIEGIQDFESIRTSGSVQTSTLLNLPIGGLNAGRPDNVISYDSEGLLHTDAFGGKKEEVSYYNSFNSIFTDENERKIYAEELEILAGFDVNSIGLINFSTGNLDLIKFTFLLDYVFEASFYIIVAESIIRNLEGGNNVLYNYFYNILNYPKFSLTDKFEPLAYFLIGLNEFINTDPKIQELIKDKIVQKANLNILDIDYKNPNALWTSVLNNLTDNLFGLSKLEHNRIILLIRKFQQESHWHTNILYRAKQDSAENFIDKSFVEFSQYYFKFVVERMHIGRMIWRRKVKGYIKTFDRVKQRNRLFENRQSPSAFEAEGSYRENVIQTEENRLERSEDGRYKGDYSSRYRWAQHLSRNKGDNTHSITALPQLFKTNTYIKKVILQSAKLRQNFDDSDIKENKVDPQKRLSPEIVRKVEEYLNSEYMPFYFHDLRTNEIISFHAFIDTISDSFSPEYTSTSGYGRIDDVKHYVKTTRIVNTTFSIVSYNQDDHDLMWYQINKLVAMVYPQWSKGIKRGKGIAYPFTQMPTASPLIRLRIGDVITSNYSKENLARLHVHGGKIGRQKVSTIAKKEKNTNLVTSEAGNFSQINTPKKIRPNAKINIDPNNLNDKFAYAIFNPVTASLGVSNRENMQKISSFKTLSKDEYESLSEDQKKCYTIRPQNENSLLIKNIITDDSNYYVATTIDNFDFGISDSPMFYISKKDVKIEKDKEYKNIAGKSVVDAKNKNGSMNNPFTAAYESSRGQGLAGFITNLDVNYNDMVWQTEIEGSRAPMMVKITISFAPVHDIPMGLDHLGEMRAPAYNVGSLNRQIFRTPYDDIDN